MNIIIKYQQLINVFLVFIFSSTLCFSIYRDYENIKDGYSGDLRKRIVGARYMDKGYSPYFFKWNNQYPSEFFIKDESQFPIKQNVVTLPPSYLWLLQPIAKLNFGTIEIYWYIFQYVSLLLIFSLFYCRSDAISTKNFLLGIYSLLLFSCGWIKNIDIGQSYILFPFLLSILYIAFRDHRHLLFYCGIFIGICTWLRPTYLLFALPFCFADNKLFFFRGLVLICFLAISQIFLCGHLNIWLDFFKSSSNWLSYFYHNPSGEGFGNLVMPSVVEGQTDFSITLLPDYLANIPINLRHFLNISLPGSIFTLIFLFAVIILIFFFFTNRKIEDPAILLLSGFMFYYIGEIFMWAPKYSYYFVELIFPICLLGYNQKKVNNNTLILLIIGLSLSVFRILPMGFLLGEYISASAIFLHVLSTLKKS